MPSGVVQIPISEETTPWRDSGEAWFKTCCGQKMIKQIRHWFRPCGKHIRFSERRWICKCCGRIEADSRSDDY